MITFNWILMAVAALGQEGTDLSAAERAIFEAAGVVVSPRGRAPEGEESFVAPRAFDVAWETDPGQSELAVSFLSIPGVEYFHPQVAPPHPEYAEWMNSVEVPTWNTTGDGVMTTLKLRQGDATDEVRGSVSLKVPDRIRAQGTGQVEVLEAVTGCALVPFFDTPLALDDSEQELHFFYDLHNLVDMDGVYLTLSSPNVELPQIPVDLALDRDPMTATPGQLDFKHQETAVLELRGRQEQELALGEIRCSPCVELTYSELVDDVIRLHFQETSLAEVRHSCSSVQVEANLGVDPEPYYRGAGILHARRPVDFENRLSLFGVFAPGETVEVRRTPKGSYRLNYPDRIPCFGEDIEGWGWSLEDSFQTPLEETASLDLQIDGKTNSFRVRGRVRNATFKNLGRWVGYCSERPSD